MKAESSSLGARSVSAFFWGGGGAFLRLFMQTAAQIVLARLLGPEQYGLFAISVVVMSFSSFFSDIGMAYGLIQRQQLDHTHIRFVLGWQLVLGLLVSAALLLLASPLADFFREPRLQSVIFALAPLAFLQAVNAVSMNLLKRDLNYKHLQIGQTVGYFVGYVCLGIPLALQGAGVWSLVVAWGVQSVVSFVLLFRAARHPLRPLWRHPDAGSMGRFGGMVLLTNMTNWLIGNVDRTLVARTLDAASLGLYANAYNLVNTPSGTVLGFMQPVMYSACARVQDDPQRIRKAFLLLMAGIALVAMPVFWAMSAVASTLVLALYGAAWAPAATVLQPLALAMPVTLLWGITTPVLWNTGRTGAEFKLQLPMAALWLLVAWQAAQVSLTVLAWSVLGLFVVRTLVFTRLAIRQIGVRWLDCALALRGGVVLAACVATAAWGTDQALLQAMPGHAARLVAVVAACVLTTLCAVRLLPRLFTAELADMARAGVKRLPPATARLVAWLLTPQLTHRHEH